jgi:sugar phosphate isomerase/epimerase
MTEGLSINLATIRGVQKLADAIDLCARLGIEAIAPWREQVQALGITAAARLVRERGMRVTGLCRGGMFPAASKEARRAAIDDNRRAIEEAAALGADCLVLIAGGLPVGSRDIVGAREMVAEGVAEILSPARAARVRLAIEPLHPMTTADRGCVNTIGHALDLCERLGEGVGVAIDVYHVWWDPDLARQIARGRGRILAHHISDWLVPTRDLVFDRGMMGDGVIDLASIRRMIEAAGFDGPQEVEIFSAENWWKRDPAEVITTCIERYRACCRAGANA